MAAQGSTAFKVVLLGEGRVGKTCLVLRYVQNQFSDAQESTIQATYLEKKLNIFKKSIRLQIWDTAGQERFHALAPIYYRDANGALLVYDITDRDSFTKVRNWVKELRKIVDGEGIVLVIAGNKADLEKKRQVDPDEAQKYADSVGAIHMLVSAKSGNNVEAAFLEITKGMIKVKDDSAKVAAPSANRRGGMVEITDDNKGQSSKSGCC